MQYKEHKPSSELEKYVKCYYTIVCEPGVLIEDKAFATGCIEVMFTISGSSWQTKLNGEFTTTSQVELWGQIVRPLTFKTSGQGEIFGIRFYPATAAVLLKEELNEFNDGVFDLVSVLGNPVKELHAKLQEFRSTNDRINLVDAYLLHKLTAHTKTLSRIDLVQQVMNDLTKKDFFDNINNVAARYGITSRYLQKIFLHYTGLTPKLYSQINRFQNSLVLLGKGDQPLTAIAYECGYFDQSHFIREFKSFTGFSPSGFDPDNSSAILASPNK
ncbi:MAG TPA: helix-turn-helix transcriptional regulator [Cyclobacteriaceae bacterium]|nr:helix-turn-helix transcriptional regulator [Cyclobacteriaceae bacterium]